MTLQLLNPKTIAPPVGAYSQGVLAPAGGQWLYGAGQVGLARDGVLADGFAAQAKTAWQNLIAVLHAGAYGLTFSPVLFLGHPTPAEVLIDGGDARVVRERGAAEDALRGQRA